MGWGGESEDEGSEVEFKEGWFWEGLRFDNDSRRKVVGQCSPQNSRGRLISVLRDFFCSL